MSQEEGKNKILNPKGMTPIMKAVKCDEDNISSTVKERVVDYLRERLKSQDVVQKFVELEGEADAFY